MDSQRTFSALLLVVRVFHDLASLKEDKNPQPQQQTTVTTTTAAGSAADQAHRPVARN